MSRFSMLRCFIGGCAVLLTVVLAVVLLAPVFSRRPPPTPTIVTTGNLTQTYTDILWFEELEGRWPSNLDELGSKLQAEEIGSERGRFVDGWGHTLKYVVTTPEFNPGRFDLYSVGPNGKDDYAVPNFGDDIHVRSDGTIMSPATRRKIGQEQLQ